MNLCLNNCGNNTKTKFCSRSCANSYNNKIHPKRKPEHACKNCSTPITASYTYCSTCKPGKERSERMYIKACETCKIEFISKSSRNGYCSKGCNPKLYINPTITIGSLRKKSIRHAQVYNSLRQASRRIAIELGLTSCEICGYDVHVEVSHIQGLSTLPDDFTVTNAISRSNFYTLCKNHHWEFDHGYLKI